MPITGLVITLTSEPVARRAALDAMSAHRAIELGEAAGDRLPVVVEAKTPDENAALWEWLHALAGVQFVDVAYVSFEDQPENEPRTLAALASPSHVDLGGTQRAEDIKS